MKIAYNPETANALTAVPSDNDIIFDLAGKAIYAKGVKFEGITYSVFKKHTSEDDSGGYNGLVPVPSYTTTTTRYLREDGTWTTPPAYGVFTGATDSEEGKIGLVPAPKTTDVGKVLSADGGWVSASLVGHIHSTKDITSLTDYTKLTDASDIAVTDTLNTALGKLEYKADTAYKWVTSVTDEDTDDYINKWGEIVEFLDSVKEGTDILDEFVTVKTSQTIIGAKTFTNTLTTQSINPLSNTTYSLGAFDKKWSALHSINIYSNAIYNGTNIYSSNKEIIHSDDEYFELNKGYPDVIMWFNASEYKFNVGSSGAQFMIDTNGNVGIGDVGGAPAYKLHVGGGEVMADTYHAWSGGFKKNGSSNSYVLLGGGGHKAIADFAAASHSHSYLPLAGGLMNSDAYISWNNGANGNDVSDWNITDNGLRIISSVSTDTNAPTQYSTALHVKGRYGFQLASAGGADSNSFYIKNVHNTVWNSLIHSGNIGSLSVNYATSSSYSRNLLGRTTAGTDYNAVAGNLIFAEWNTHSDNRWYLKAEGYETRVAYATSAGNADKLDDIDSTGFLQNYSLNYSDTISNAVDISPTLTAGIARVHISNIEYSSVLTGYDFNSKAWQLRFRPSYNDGIYFRSQGIGTTWKKLAFTSDIPTVTNYYWANVKVSASSSTSTYPTFANMKSTGRVYLDEWIQFNGGTGLYWPNNYGAHFYPNVTSTYGQFQLLGVKNSYSGIHFGDSKNYMTVMSTDTHHGLYCENTGWEFYYNRSNTYIGLRTSYIPYPITMDGDSYTTGWSRAASGFYIEGTGVHYTSQGGIGEINLTSNNEFVYSTSNGTLYFNYRGAPRGTTVTNYIWNAGSSSTYASHTMGLAYFKGSGKYLYIGPQNASHAHYVTDATVSHWFNKTVQVDGNVEPYGNNEHSSGSSSNRWSNVYSLLGNFAGNVNVGGHLILKGSTSTDMTYSGNIHPSIYFENSDSSQNVRLIFTDYDSYRSPAGLKLVGNQGSEWFEVVGYMYGAGFVKSGSSNSYVLLGGGGHKAVSDFATASALNNYLPLSGGTMTGAIVTPGNDTVVIKPAKNNYDQIGASDCVFWKIFATNFYGTLNGNCTGSAGKAATLSGGSIATWGTLTAANGYTNVCTWDTGNTTGAFSLAGKGGQMSLQLDGFFYQNEGKYLVLDTNNYTSYLNGRYFPYNGWWTSGSGQNVNDANGMTFVYSNHGSPNGWGILCTFDYQYNSSYKFQLFAEGYTAAGMYYRCRSADRGGWTNWKTVIDSGNIGSQSVNYSSSAGISNYLKIHDIRDNNYAPNSTNWPLNNIRAWFNRTGTPDTDWWSGITVKGWTDDYNVWLLTSTSDNANYNIKGLFFRTGNGATWDSWQSVSTTRVFTVANNTSVADFVKSYKKLYAGLWFSRDDYAWALSATINVGSYGLDRMRYSAICVRTGNLNTTWLQSAMLFVPTYSDKKFLYLAQMYTGGTAGSVTTSVKRYADYDTIIQGSSEHVTLIWIGYIYRSSQSVSTWTAQKLGGPATFNLTISNSSTNGNLGGNCTGYTILGGICNTRYVGTGNLSAGSTTEAYTRDSGLGDYMVYADGTNIYIKKWRQVDENKGSARNDELGETRVDNNYGYAFTRSFTLYIFGYKNDNL